MFGNEAALGVETPPKEIVSFRIIAKISKKSFMVFDIPRYGDKEFWKKGCGYKFWTITFHLLFRLISLRVNFYPFHCQNKQLLRF